MCIGIEMWDIMDGDKCVREVVLENVIREVGRVFII